MTRVPAYLFATGREQEEEKYARVTKIVFSNTVTDIGEYAFFGCYDLKEVNWGTGVCRIGDSAFERASKLTSVTVSKAATKTAYIRDCAFKDCTSLRSITIKGDLEDNDPYSTYSYDDYYSVFYNAGSRGSTFTVTFAEGVTKIPEYLFATGDEKSDDTYAHITSMTIPASVKEIGNCAFYRCYDLKTVTVYGRNTVFDEEVFGECPSTMTIKGYEGSTAETYANENGLRFVPLSMPVPTLSSVESAGWDVIVKWKKLDRATSYRVYRKISSGSWKLLSTVSTLSYTDPTPLAGSVYSYKVKAKLDGIWTEDSNVITKRHIPFTDVSMADSYFDEVNWAVNNNIISGTSKMTFSPNAECKRYQMVVFLNKFNRIYHFR